MTRIVLNSASIVAALVGGYLVKRKLTRAMFSWGDGDADLPPILRPNLRTRWPRQPRTSDAGNGEPAIYSTDQPA